MFWLKACERCGGDLRSVSDIWGPSVVCIQCGREHAQVHGGAEEGRQPAIKAHRVQSVRHCTRDRDEERLLRAA